MNAGVDAYAQAAASCAGVARRRDPDRYLCAMFLPAEARTAALVLIAFNYELSRALTLPVSGEITGPMAGLIRLQWWRDVIADPTRAVQARHDVAIALTGLMAAGRIDPHRLLEMIDGRETELCDLEDWGAWRRAMLGGPGTLQVLMAALLGIADAPTLELARRAGAAFAAGTLLRHLPVVLRSGRAALPRGEGRGDVSDPAQGDTALAVLVSRLREEGMAFLPPRPARPSRAVRLALLPAVLARRDLARPPVASDVTRRGVGDVLAVTLAAAGWR